uniref:Equilibrative nucleoside transporter family protein n=1 Tax=Rhizophora mucronata TaxID=61149 RepID=A0A2P2KM90_RHIMU
MSKNRERTATIRPFLDFNFNHPIRGRYLDIRSHRLYIATRTTAYLQDHEHFVTTNARQFFEGKLKRVAEDWMQYE